VLQVVLAPPPVTFARSRRQSFSEFKSTSSHTPVIFLTKSVIFIYVTDSDDYRPVRRRSEGRRRRLTALSSAAAARRTNFIGGGGVDFIVGGGGVGGVLLYNICEFCD
jgi:hypothetical protein